MRPLISFPSALFCVSSVCLVLISALIIYSPVPQHAAPANNFYEGFDDVEPPFEMPDGWTSIGYQTTSFAPVHTPENAVMGFASNGFNVFWHLTSPPIALGQISPKLVFHHHIRLSDGMDGGVLDIKIENGPWVDIVDAGGSFIENGYTSTINAPTNPIDGRRSWAGDTGQDFIRTEILLPSNARGRTIQLRWGLGLDNSGGGTGWRIDSVTVGSLLSGENPQTITIPSAGIADPYPSEAVVSGLTGWVTKASVTIESFSHTSPKDVDLLLVGPNGKKIVLMSDVGGSTPVTNARLVFKDDAAGGLPVDGPLVAGEYRPTNHISGDPFPAPAPQGRVNGTSLAVFRGMNPNGSWRLFLVDDSGNNLGALTGGWGVTLETSPQCTLTLLETLRSIPASGGSTNFQFNVPQGCIWSVLSNSEFLQITSPPVGSGDASVDVAVQANPNAERVGVIAVSRGDDVRTILIDQMAGCPVPAATTPQNFNGNGGSGAIDVSASQSCVWRALSNADWIQITDAPQSGDRRLNFSVLPNPYQTARTGTISVGLQTIVVSQSAAVTRSQFDFDGDGRADVSVFRPANGIWYVLGSAIGFQATHFGLSSDVLAPADYDGDGKTDHGVFRDGTWYLLRSTGGLSTFQFGLQGDVPVPGDYDGDGRADIGVFRNGDWYHLRSSDGQARVVRFGITSDKPVPADFNADGITDLAIYRSGVWWIYPSGGQPYAVRFGLAADRTAPADYDGDGRADLAVFRSGVWYILRSSEGFFATQFGIASDKPTPADYDGDGRADIAVFRSGVWYIDRSTAGLLVTGFGLDGDRPVTGILE